MNWLWWLLSLSAAFAGLSLFALWSYGRFARKARGPDSHRLPRAEGATRLDRLSANLCAGFPGKSGAATLFDNRAAFSARLRSIQMAERSIDMQYYIWRDDMTGRLLARELLAAADRGVRVRLLLDDVNVVGLDPGYLDLDDHPLIEVRLINPIIQRKSALRRGFALMLALVRYNRRMHNKSWIADGQIAIVGGRNIGDTYFEAARRGPNSLDSDLLLVGPVVDALEEMFDAYWNSEAALPITALWAGHATDLRAYRRRLERMVRRPRTRDYLARTLMEGIPELEMLRWSRSIRMITDPPEKVANHARETWLPHVIEPMLESAERRVQMITPYFVPGKEGIAPLIRLAQRGVEVEIVTNSLAATNHTVVHGAYRRYRRALLAAGVKLYEYAPPEDAASRGRMLHGKTIQIDDRLGFVGSFNYDLRSALLNTEMGILFEEKLLIGDLERFFAGARAHSYALSLEGRWIRWHNPNGKKVADHWYEPHAGPFRRAMSWVVGHLPIHSYL